MPDHGLASSCGDHIGRRGREKEGAGRSSSECSPEACLSKQQHLARQPAG